MEGPAPETLSQSVQAGANARPRRFGHVPRMDTLPIGQVSKSWARGCLQLPHPVDGQAAPHFVTCFRADQGPATPAGRFQVTNPGEVGDLFGESAYRQQAHRVGTAVHYDLLPCRVMPGALAGPAHDDFGAIP